MTTRSTCFMSARDSDISIPQSNLVPLGTSYAASSSWRLSPPISRSSAAISMPKDFTPRKLAGFRLAMTISFLPIILSGG